MIVSDGLWVIKAYDSYIVYPKEAIIYLILGVCLTMMAHWIVQRDRKRATQEIDQDSGIGRDNRVFVDKIWRQRLKIGNQLIVSLIVIFAIISIFDFGMALSLLNPIIFLGMIGYWFLYIMHDEDKDNAKIDLQPKSDIMRYILRRIDSREHPVSLPLFLFIIIVLTYLLSKHFGFTLSLETSGNPRYVMSLPTGAFVTAGLIFACGFIYIIHHCDFLGIRQKKQSDYKVMRIHFTEIIICGATFFIWLVTVCGALFFES